MCPACIATMTLFVASSVFHGRANGSRGEEISTQERWEDYHTQTRAKNCYSE